MHPPQAAPRGHWACPLPPPLFAPAAANRAAIAAAGALGPLVLLLQNGTLEAKRWAALALGNLAADNGAASIDLY